MLISSVIQCLLHKPFWTDFGGILLDFLNHLVTMDETWIHILVYDPETKEQSKEWRHNGPRDQKISRHRSHQASCWRASVLWDKDGILLLVYLEKGAIITAKYYFALLYKLKQQLVTKLRGKLSKGNLFLQDNAAPQKAAITHQKLAELHFEVLKHPVYSPDLAPSDYYLFPNLKKRLMGRKFSSIEGATLAADGWFAAQPK
jgi:histone-lysine N-methyltransferase SETMAR